MADVNQLTAAAGIVAAQEQENQKRKQLEADIAARASLLAAKAQESQQNSEISSAVKQYEGLAKQEADLSGVLERGFKPGGFYRGAKPISDEDRLVYMQKLQGVQQQKEAIASSLKGYLTPEPEKPLPASQLPAPQPTPAAPQPAQPPQQPAQQPSEQMAPRGQFDEYSRLSQKRDKFLNLAMRELQKLPLELQNEGAAAIKNIAEQKFKLPDNVARPIIDPFTGQPLQDYAIINGKVEKIEKGGQKLSRTMERIAEKSIDSLYKVDEGQAQLDQILERLKDPTLSNDQKATEGKAFLNQLNIIRSLGPNVLGVDEYKRLGAPLETNWLNVKGLFNEQQFIGRDIPRFITELEATGRSLRAIKSAGIQKLGKIDPQAASIFSGGEQQPEQPIGSGQVVPGKTYNYQGGKYTPQR